ncbi:MAG: alkaline phosphatase family protein, partial [Bryobacteraceae bacterium]
MPAVEVLDSLGLPLISDHFPYPERFQGFQLLQRGVRWKSLQHAAQKRFSKSPKQLFDEWQTGFEVGNTVNQQTERELLQHVVDPSFRYLDYFTGDFDHIAHLTPDRESQWRVLEEIDALVGRVWTAINNSALANQTVLVVVSDHGMNTEPGVYSQGFSLLDFLNSRAGGGHHVITNRHPLSQYKLRGLDPFVSEVTTASGESLYLKGESGDFPTAALDLDGNERASVWLRNSDVNELQILLRALDRGEVKGALRTAAIQASLGIVERHRAEWESKLQDLQLELAALHRCADALETEIARQPKRWTAAQKALGLDKDARRLDAHLFSWRSTERRYGTYAQALTNLLSLEEKSFEPGAGKLETLIPKRFLGDPNPLGEVCDYIAGPAASGLVLSPSGGLDIERSFVHIDYPALLLAQRVRNQPQPQVGVQPVDFVAVTIPERQIASVLSQEDKPNRDAVWLYSGENDQALVLSRRDATTGEHFLRYLPVAHLHADENGAIHFNLAPWRAGIPLHYWEDSNLRLPQGSDRDQWLSQWHSERDWFRA